MVDLDTQENYKVQYTSSLSIVNTGEPVFRCSRDGKVIDFDKEGFKKFVAESDDPYVKAMGAIYELGFIEGLKT